MRPLKQTLLIALAWPATVMAGPPTGAVTGTIPLPARPSGRIAVEKYTGTISGKVAAPPRPCAGVWIEGPGVHADASPPEAGLAQQGYQFSSSLLVVQRGATVGFPNNDVDYHNIYSLSAPLKFNVERYKKDEAPTPRFKFDKAGFVRVQCEIHDHMKGAILVVDSPWYTVTDSAGKFTLTGILPGSYTLRAQFDEKTRWSVPVTITAGKTVTADVSKPSSLP